MSGWMSFQWILLILVAFPAGNFLRRRKNSRVMESFCVIVLFGYIWALGQHTENCAYLYWRSETIFHVGLLVCYAGMCTLGSACVYFAWRFSGRYRLCRDKRVVGGLFGLSGIFYLIVLSNEWHHLYYTSFSISSRTYGPAFYVFTIFSYACFFYSYILVQRAKWDGGGSNWMFAICFGAPVLANTLIMILKDPAKDVTPACYVVLLGMSYLIAYRYHPVHLTPVAAKHVFNWVHYPVSVEDDRGTALYRNPEAAAMPLWAKNGERFAYEGKVYEPIVAPLPDGKIITALTDITEYDDALREQKRLNADLMVLRSLLDEQAEELRQYETIAAELATERRRMEIMSRLNADVETELQKLREGIVQSLAQPTQDIIKQNERQAISTFTIVRNIFNEYKRR
jgi:hypothetical protein